jgi:hypothetical protein
MKGGNGEGFIGLENEVDGNAHNRERGNLVNRKNVRVISVGLRGMAWSEVAGVYTITTIRNAVIQSFCVSA